MCDLLHKQRKFFADRERWIMKAETVAQKRYTPPSDAQLEVNYHEGKLTNLRYETDDLEKKLASLRALPKSDENNAAIAALVTKQTFLGKLVEVSTRKANEARERMGA